MESSEDTDHPNGEIAGIDLEVRIRRYNEETTNLREDLIKAEETVLNLERELIVTKTALYAQFPILSQVLANLNRSSLQ